MASNSANSLAIQLQKISSNAQIQAQKLANQATEKSFQYNAKEANTARSWQKEMSDTAHQREVKDLIKAGLNPVLAANQGAQSYTTSSASAQAADPSGAAASLASSQMSGMAQGYSADKSAAATRYAAKESASAMRAAAAAQASAARYAAAMNYQTQKDSWAWKTAYMKEEYKQKTQYMLKTPVHSVSGLIDKYAQKTGLADVAVSSRMVKKVTSGVNALLNNPQKAFVDIGKKLNSSNFTLSSAGKAIVNNNLAKLNVTSNSITRKLFVKAFVFGNNNAYSALMRYMPSKPKKIKYVSAADKYRAYSMR